MSEARLHEFFSEICADLTRTMDFWIKHSHDTEYGGFFNCLGPKGDVYDDTKHIWLQGRQVWMYARLYNDDEEFRKPEILLAAQKGAEFLKRYGKDPKTNRCYLSVTRDGRPIKIQQTIFSECFYTMAMSELARCLNNGGYREEALTMMDKIVYWVKEDSSDIRLGVPPLPGAPTNVNSLAVPMMLLCLVDQLQTMDVSLSQKYSDIADWSVRQALAHIQRDGSVILENVGPSGEELPGCHGRLMIPGHSIEAGWFLLQYARKKKQSDLIDTAINKFMLNPLKYGWDDKHGGLFYFLDVDGHSPIQLEWNMKLWWTHNETMIAFLMAYQETRDTTMLDKFAQVFDYCYSKHVDRTNGEWAGYLNQDGTVSLKFKGGPWKGCFHVPRALLYCKRILRDLLHK